MKFYLKILIYIIFFTFTITTIFLAVNSGKFNRVLKYTLEYILYTNGIEAEFMNLSFRDGNLKATRMVVSAGSGKIIIHDINLAIKYKKYLLLFDLNPGKIELLDGNTVLIDAVYSGRLDKNLSKLKQNMEFKLTNINIFNIQEKNYSNNGTLTYKYNETKKDFALDFNLALSESAYLNAKHLQGSDKIDIVAKNISLSFHSLIGRIFPKHGLTDFFNKFIRKGYIKELNINIGTDKKQLVFDKLYGTAKIEQLDFSYDEELPILKNIDIDVLLDRSKVLFYINKANSTEILISDGVIDMDWKGIDHTILKIKAKGKGQAKGLADFISEDKHKVLQKINIDLHKIKGDVIADINIDIPLKPGTKDIYNITAKVHNTSLAIFKENIKLTSGSINGIFNGEQIILDGICKINGLKSDLNFIYNINDESEFSHKLDINTLFATKLYNKINYNKIPLTKFIHGDSMIKFNYINKNSEGFISAKADITDLDLVFDKLGIHKKRNEKSKILINGIFDDPQQGKIDFSISGKNNLAVYGNVSINPKRTIIDIKSLRNKETNLSAKLTLTEHLFTSELSGKVLDLSEVNMLNFLKKERDSTNVSLNLNIKKLILKNNVLIDNLILALECNQYNCYKGFIDARIATKPLEVLISTKDSNEEWLITCSDAGALLKGFDMYNDMNHGNVIINVITDRKEVKTGEIIPILNGNFAFERFEISHTPIILRIVSFVSLPGFLSTISGNKNIGFSGMKGSFTFQNNILTIENSLAKGPFFDFTMKGNIDTKNRVIDVNGYVNPELYGISSILGSIPVIGRIFIGNSKHRGIVSQSYNLKESY